MRLLSAFFAMFLACYFCWGAFTYPVTAEATWYSSYYIIKATHFVIGVSLFANAFRFVRRNSKDLSDIRKHLGLLATLIAAIAVIGAKTIYIIVISPKFAELFAERQTEATALAEFLWSIGTELPLVVTSALIGLGIWSCVRNNERPLRHDVTYIITTLLLFVILFSYSMSLSASLAIAASSS